LINGRGFDVLDRLQRYFTVVVIQVYLDIDVIV